MSTIPDRQTKPEAPRARSTTRTKPQRKPGAASFRYGWRYVKKKLSHGRIDFDMVPLTLEDVLHPRFGDHHVLTTSHNRDCNYLQDVLRAHLADDRAAAVSADLGIFWDVPRLKHHSPDIAVILGVKRQKAWKTFHVATEGVRPALIIEVTSPATRVNDVKTKVKQYARAKVPYYVIADAEGTKPRRLKLIAYRLVDGAYQKQPLDEQGRAWLEPVGLWLGVKLNEETGEDRLALFDPESGEEIGDYTAISRALEAAEARARAAKKEAQTAKKQARTAKKQAQAAKEQVQAEVMARAEAQSRAELAEERLRQVEAELRRLRGDG